MFAKLFVFCGLLFLWGCSSPQTSYEIGVDPSWHTEKFQQRERNVLGFSTELLAQMSKEEHVLLSIIQTNWDSLFEGLKTGKYQAVISSLHPRNFNEKLYNFSDPLLLTGPVFVAPIDSSDELSIDALSGKAVGVLEASPEILLLEKNPNLLIRTYVSVPNALNALVSGDIEAALLPVLNTSAYVRNLYFKKLKIASAPLTQEGLRLISLKKQTQLIQTFNAFLKKAKKHGTYQSLQTKWNLEEN